MIINQKNIIKDTSSSGRWVDAGWKIQISCLNSLAVPSHGIHIKRSDESNESRTRTA